MSDNEEEASQAPPSEASSAPPNPQGQQIPADRLRQHPVWEAAAGRGPRNEWNGGSGNSGPGRGPVSAGGRGRGKGSGSGGGGSHQPEDAESQKPRYERISLSALEAEQYCDADGADSRIDSDDDEWAEDRVRPDRAPSERGRGGDLSEGENDDEDGSDDDERPSRRDRLNGLMGAAAFGGAACGRSGAHSDAHSQASESSSKRRRDASKDAFPVRGVPCVGCALPNRIGPVNRFIQLNISNMTEDALWKMAALTYKREVAQPAEREGAVVPRWGWKDIRSHYEIHCTGNFIARHTMVRTMQNIRGKLSSHLVRVDGGDEEIDRQTADLILKTMAQESKERVILDQSMSAKRARTGRESSGNK